MTSDELKAFCKERGLTYAQLAERIGNSEASVKSAIAKGELSSAMSKSIELLKEIEYLRSELNNYEILKKALSNALKNI